MWLPHPQPPPCLFISCHWRLLGPMLVRVCAQGRLQGPTVAHTGVIRGDRLTPLPPHRRCHRFLLLLLAEGWSREVGTRVSSAGASSSAAEEFTTAAAAVGGSSSSKRRRLTGGGEREAPGGGHRSSKGPTTSTSSKGPTTTSITNITSKRPTQQA